MPCLEAGYVMLEAGCFMFGSWLCHVWQLVGSCLEAGYVMFEAGYAIIEAGYVMFGSWLCHV